MGSWDAVHDISAKDADGNSAQGNVLAFDCKDTLIRAGKRLVAAVGVEGVSVIETPDAVLVAGRGASQDVRKVVDALAQRSAQEHIVHITVRRPWGAYTVLEEGPGFKIKRIEVSPGGRLSLQSHEQRSEHWVVVAGEATVTKDGDDDHADRATRAPTSPSAPGTASRTAAPSPCTSSRSRSAPTSAKTTSAATTTTTAGSLFWGRCS